MSSIPCSTKCWNRKIISGQSPSATRSTAGAEDDKTMVSFPNCKINLGLKILRRREDGFHDLQTIFYPLPLYDILEAVRSPDLQFSATGRPIPGDPGANLTIRAWQLLRQDFPDLPFVHIHLHKKIPIGGGLGGGSADGAFMLDLLNRQFRLGLDAGRLA